MLDLLQARELAVLCFICYKQENWLSNVLFVTSKRTGCLMFYLLLIFFIIPQCFHSDYNKSEGVEHYSFIICSQLGWTVLTSAKIHCTNYYIHQMDQYKVCVLKQEGPKGPRSLT